jgi:hypothetical protein
VSIITFKSVVVKKLFNIFKKQDYLLFTNTPVMDFFMFKYDLFGKKPIYHFVKRLLATYLVPIYNKNSLVMRALDSIFYQTIRDFEFLVNGSTNDGPDCSKYSTTMIVGLPIFFEYLSDLNCEVRSVRTLKYYYTM